MKTLLTVIGLLVLVGSAIYLYLGSKSVPSAMQTWKGESEAETAFRRSQKRRAVGGFVLLGIGTLIQLVALFLFPN